MATDVTKDVAAQGNSAGNAASGPQWEDVLPPLPVYFSWGSNPGQELQGQITLISPEGGKDYANRPCPQYEFALTSDTYSESQSGVRTDMSSGDLILLNVTSKSLARHLRFANVKVRDEVRIRFYDTVKVPEGIAKQFSVAVRRA